MGSETGPIGDCIGPGNLSEHGMHLAVIVNGIGDAREFGGQDYSDIFQATVRGKGGELDARNSGAVEGYGSCECQMNDVSESRIDQGHLGQSGGEIETDSGDLGDTDTSVENSSGIGEDPNGLQFFWGEPDDWWWKLIKGGGKGVQNAVECLADTAVEGVKNSPAGIIARVVSGESPTEIVKKNAEAVAGMPGAVVEEAKEVAKAVAEGDVEKIAEKVAEAGTTAVVTAGAGMAAKAAGKALPAAKHADDLPAGSAPSAVSPAGASQPAPVSPPVTAPAAPPVTTPAASPATTPATKACGATTSSAPAVPVITNITVVGRKLDAKGTPNSRVTLTGEDGTVKQIREYGADGNAVRDTDYHADHGAGRPHIHEWKVDPADGILKRGEGKPMP